jgi:sialic acid synthase SpsE
MESMKLGRRTVSGTSRPYIVAEIGVNHEGSLDQARKLVDLAKEGGADGAKFQTYKAETLVSRHSPAYWDTTKEPTRSQFELFKKYDTFGPKEYKALAEHCRGASIDFLSTPFDDAAIELLDPLVPFFKVASADLTNLPFLRKVAAKRKPVLLSTGASTMAEIDIAVNALRRAGCSDIVLLHCILNYPTENPNAHLRMITGLKRAYPELLVGYSDHTVPSASMASLFTSHLLGAAVLEKHFTHDKTLPGNDHYHAMDVHDLKRFVNLLDEIHDLLGGSDYKAPIESEGISRLNARRSIVITRSVRKGSKLDASMLTYKRPGTGISPLHWDEVIGAAAARDLEEDHVLTWSDVVPRDNR